MFAKSKGRNQCIRLLLSGLRMTGIEQPARLYREPRSRIGSEPREQGVTCGMVLCNGRRFVLDVMYEEMLR